MRKLDGMEEVREVAVSSRRLQGSTQLPQGISGHVKTGGLSTSVRTDYLPSTWVNGLGSSLSYAWSTAIDHHPHLSPRPQ